MDVSVESPGGLIRRLKVLIPADRVSQAVDDKIKRAGQHAKIPGFRPGKAPKKVLYQRYGAQARREAAEELVQSAYPKAVEQSELKPAGQPQIELGDFDADQPLEFTARFDVYPEIELTGLDDIAIEKPTAEVTEADVDNAIERIREQNKTYVGIERASEDGDQVVIDYTGRIDGETFEGGSGRDIEVTLGEQRFLPELERALVGRSAVEQFETDVVFPDDYGAKELAGKTATFDITVKSVNEPRPAELDQALLEKLGVADGGVEALQAKVRESLVQEVANAVDTRVKTQVMDALHAANPIQVPESMVAQEIERMRAEAMQRMPQHMQQDTEQAKRLLPDDALRENAERRVALGLLIAEVISVRQLELDEARVNAKMEEVAAGYGEQAEAVKNYYRQNQQLMHGLQAMVMEEQVVENLLQGANVSEKSSNVDELLNADR